MIYSALIPGQGAVHVGVSLEDTGCTHKHACFSIHEDVKHALHTCNTDCFTRLYTNAHAHTHLQNVNTHSCIPHKGCYGFVEHVHTSLHVFVRVQRYPNRAAAKRYSTAKQHLILVCFPWTVIHDTEFFPLKMSSQNPDLNTSELHRVI